MSRRPGLPPRKLAKPFPVPLNAKRGYGWDANPWVWVLSFVRVTS